ncbi:MAG: hypothetical protein ACTHU0_09560 [Kofleriaceae bacterium]
MIRSSHIWFSLLLATGCMHNTTPASRTCSVLTDNSQLAGCIGKVVTIRGKVSSSQPAQIVGVDVDASADLRDQVAHAHGTLEQDGARFTLKDNGALAKAHSARPR